MSTVGRGALLRRIQEGMRDLTSRLHQLNDEVGDHVELSGSDIEVLDLIGRYGPMTPGALGARTGIHPATLTGVLDRLERGGWLVRRPDPDDRRRVQVEARFDRAGELARLYVPMLRSLNEICSDYTVEQLEVVAGFLDRAAQAGAIAAADLRED